MDIKKYLDRIHYIGEPAPTLETLSNLQLAHLLTVPFENLDIYNKVAIDLADTFSKVVLRRRGGFCYELNSLFYELLKMIGFSVKLVSARVFDKDKGFGPEFDHMALIIGIDNNEHLADVGFGEFAFYPLKIETGRDQSDPRGVFKIEMFEKKYKLVAKKTAMGEFVPEYIFSETERKLDDFRDMCLYHQTNPLSHFTQKRICSLPNSSGRITLTGNVLKITSLETVTEIELTNDLEVSKALWENFRIRL